MLDPKYNKSISQDFSGHLALGAKSALLEKLVAQECQRQAGADYGQAILEAGESQLKTAGIENVSAEQSMANSVRQSPRSVRI